MARLLIAIMLGIVLGAGATMLLSSSLSGTVNGTFTNASLYQYGNR